jgi:hypothetical protein
VKKSFRRITLNVTADKITRGWTYSRRSFPSVADGQRLWKFVFAKLEKSYYRGRSRKNEHFPDALGEQLCCYDRLAVRLPVYAAVEGILFLELIAAFVVFFSLGLMTCEKSKHLKWTVMIAFSFLFCLASVHILHVVLSILVLKPANLLG